MQLVFTIHPAKCSESFLSLRGGNYHYGPSVPCCIWLPRPSSLQSSKSLSGNLLLRCCIVGSKHAPTCQHQAKAQVPAHSQEYNVLATYSYAVTLA